MLAAGLLTVARGLPTPPAFLAAGTDLLRVHTDGTQEVVSLTVAERPARLLRLGSATVLLTRPPSTITGGSAYLLGDASATLTRLGPADTVVPDSRGDRVWLVRGSATKSLVAFDGRGRRVEQRTARTSHDLLMVTPHGVLDDEVGVPGGSTPTLRNDAGRVLRQLAGPVQVMDVVGPRILVTVGTCLDGCRVEMWDTRDGSSRSTQLDSGFVVLDGALSANGRSAALAARSSRAPNAPSGRDGQAVLLRGGLDGTALTTTRVDGACTLLACHVTWTGETVYASVDRFPGTLLEWRPGRAPRALRGRAPQVADLSGL